MASNDDAGQKVTNTRAGMPLISGSFGVKTILILHKTNLIHDLKFITELCVQSMAGK